MASNKDQKESKVMEIEMKPLQDSGTIIQDIPAEAMGNGIPSVTTKKVVTSCLLFQLVKNGKLEKLKRALPKAKKSMLLEKDESENTILHHAAGYVKRETAREMVEAILRVSQKSRTSKALLDMVDGDGKTALYIAAERGREKMVEAFLQWKPNLTIKCGNGPDAQTPLELIYKNVPNKILPFYDMGLNLLKIMRKYALISSSGGVKGEENVPFQEAENFRGLLKGSAEDFQEILNHGVVQAFIYLKYDKAYPFIVFSIVMHILWHALYAYFIFTVYYTDCPWKLPVVDAVDNQTTRQTEVRILCHVENGAFQIALAMISGILGLTFFVKEIFEVFTVPSTLRYFWELENLGQLIVCLSVGFTSWPVYEIMNGATGVYIDPWQYRLASPLVFIVWALVLGQICKIQLLRYYIELFINVFKSFGLFICTFAPLLVGFAFSFCILMPEGKSFQSPWLAVPKVLVMMTGELNYDDVFHGEKETYHYLATQLLFTLFTILMSMILLNLLIGLAVTETHELKKKSHSSELSSMLEEIFLLECFAMRLRTVFGINWFLESLSIDVRIKPRKTANVETPVDKNRLGMAGLKRTYAFGKRSKYPFPRELMKKLCAIADRNCIEHDDEESVEDESGYSPFNRKIVV